ncbi:MAG: 2,4-dichlorophenol 6-monooxygenase [Mucilaginibacter sp.]|nr:2,4-dichlorophenol 6-monooxygenase [Mucilaginibacter sp.]
METDKKVPVLIVGGGISGLTAALFLLKHNIIPLVIERHRSTSIHPRARGFDIRTMELYRELSLSEQIREVGKALSPGWGIYTNSSLAGALKKVKPRKGAALQSPIQMKGLEALAAESPEMNARCTQDLSEPVLLEAAKERGAEIFFFTELLSFQQDEAGVTAIIRHRETGEQQTLQADYMIAADGAKSNIRETLKAETIGKGVLGNLLNIYFEADLADFVRGREFSLLRVDEPDIKGLLASINNSDRWVFHLHYDPAKGERPEDFTQERIITILEKVIGLPQLKISIISVLPWQPTVKVVAQMQHGHVFLVGDAAHVMTPYGGKGACTGVQDVQNLAWKLAAVIQGKATPALLYTYNTERQVIGQYNAEQSGKMANQYGLIKKVIYRFYRAFMTVMVINFLRLQKLFPKTGMRQLGDLMGLPDYKYSSSAIISNEVPVSGYIKAGLLNGQPGTRLPHLWVIYQGQKISTLDLLGKGFVLFTGIDNACWKQAANKIATEFDMTISIYSIGDNADLVYNGRQIQDVLGIEAMGVILIRPDGFVTWRCKEQPATPSAELKSVLGKILHGL